jgi:20S proteasome alpha/beta subunit
MILLETDDILVSMTLTLAVHNGKDIVVASDKMALSGKKEKVELNHQKIFKLNDNTALLISGVFHDFRLMQFIRQFTYNAQKHNVTDTEQLFKILGGEAQATLEIEDYEVIEFIIAGFSDNKPWIRYMSFSGKDRIPKIDTPKSNYEAGGYIECVSRAKELLSEKCTENLSTPDLKKIVREVLVQCKKEDSRLGGKNDIKVIRLDV